MTTNNAGDVDLAEANAFLQTLGIDEAAGPGQVSFRVPVAMTVVHEDADSDVGTFQYRLEEIEGRMRRTRLDGYPNGFRVARPSRADADTGRRHTVVSADLRLTVTVPAHVDDEHLVALATALLRDDLHCLRDEVDLLDEPTVWDIATLPPDAGDDTDSSDGGSAYHADELDEGNYIDYGPDTEPDETTDGFNPTTPWRGRSQRNQESYLEQHDL